MGMRVSDGGSSGAGQSASAAGWQQKQQSFKALTSALKSGDLAAAQQAFSSISNGSGSSGNGPLAQIGQALQNGDLAGAQKAEADLKTKRGGHHHHHQQDADGAGASAPPPTPPPSTADVTGTGTQVDTVA